MTQKDEHVLRLFERRILRGIFGVTSDENIWRRRYNHELYELYGEPDIVRHIKINRLRWLGHVQRVDKTRILYCIRRRKCPQRSANLQLTFSAIYFWYRSHHRWRFRWTILIKFAITYRTEACHMTEKDNQVPWVFERNILRGIFEAVKDRQIWRSRFNHELYGKYGS